MATQLKTAVTIDSVYSPVIARLRNVLTSMSRCSATAGDLQDVINLLDTLPLATNEYGLYRTRLESASSYIRSGELGAASWEARTVLNQLRSASTPKTVEPRRRKALVS